MRPRCSILTGGFDFSGCGDCTSCPPIEQTEMSNSAPSASVLQGIACIRELYTFRRQGRKHQTYMNQGLRREIQKNPQGGRELLRQSAKLAAALIQVP